MRVLIVPNTDNPSATTAARALAAWLTERSDEVVLAAPDAQACGLEALGGTSGSFGSLDLVAALGGDGTILKAVHLLAGESVPILGVNLGRLGFLSGAEGAENVVPAVEAVLSGGGEIQRRSTLRIAATAGGREAGTHHALNEVFVGRGPGGRAVDIAVAVEGDEVFHAVCDGVIVCTPTGSTAYALSAGGPILDPGLRAMVLVPTGPHTLVSRPIVVGEGATVILTFPDAARADACMVVDGDAVPCRSALDGVQVVLGAHDVSLVRLDGRSFYSALHDTFFGG